jgi:hypothetical protein
MMLLNPRFASKKSAGCALPDAVLAPQLSLRDASRCELGAHRSDLFPRQLRSAVAFPGIHRAMNNTISKIHLASGPGEVGHRIVRRVTIREMPGFHPIGTRANKILKDETMNVTAVGFTVPAKMNNEMPGNRIGSGFQLSPYIGEDRMSGFASACNPKARPNMTIGGDTVTWKVFDISEFGSKLRGHDHSSFTGLVGA